MYNGRRTPWKSVARPRRVEMMQEILAVLSNASNSVRAFGVAVNKQAIAPNDPVTYAFEEICNRFNLYLTRRFQSSGGRDSNRQKGLVVMDESRYEQPLQVLAREFRINGTRWGQLRNMAEIPLFVNSRASRLVQLADLVAYALWRQYEHQDGRFFQPIISRFDSAGGVIHGLVHYRQSSQECHCPACISRAARPSNSG